MRNEIRHHSDDHINFFYNPNITSSPSIMSPSKLPSTGRSTIEGDSLISILMDQFRREHKEEDARPEPSFNAKDQQTKREHLQSVLSAALSIVDDEMDCEISYGALCDSYSDSFVTQ